MEENTGTEAVTPGPVTLEMDGESSAEAPVGLLLPAQRETLEFRHHFKKAGPTVVTARIDAKDDLSADDRLDQAVSVRGTLPVLLIIGVPNVGALMLLIFVSALVPVIGYEHATSVAKEALDSGRGVYDVVMARGLLTREQLDKVLDPEAMTGQ